MNIKKSIAANKLLLAIVILVVGGAAYVGYSKQTVRLADEPAADATATLEVAAAKDAPKPDAAIFKQQPGDILFGKASAPITIIDYSSLSCPHCAHFHLSVLPQLKKEFMDTGKVKLLFRHFPLNAPALRAAQLVDCADEPEKEKFLQVLFDMQQQWAFNEGFLGQLKQIAAVGGIDSAQFDSCIADKDSEEQILNVRKRGAEEAQVTATPTLYVNGVKLAEAPEIDVLRDAINKAGK
jgi:protein-disulfide isomerase